MFIVSGLDHRLGWSSVPLPLAIAANALVAVGFLIVFFVFRENSYASSVIEVGEHQKVISTGPYRLVRHPMYSGGLLLIAATPLALGSFWAEIGVLPLVSSIIARLFDEERVLAKDLDGYADYLRATRWRLIPRVL